MSRFIDMDENWMHREEALWLIRNMVQTDELGRYNTIGRSGILRAAGVDVEFSEEYTHSHFMGYGGEFKLRSLTNEQLVMAMDSLFEESDEPIHTIYGDDDIEISDGDLDKLMSDICPVVMKGAQLHYIEVPNPRTVAFPWSPKFLEKADDIEPYAEVTTIHTWAYHGFFKPTIAEVLAQIGTEAGTAVAFSTDPDTSNSTCCLTCDEKFQTGKTTLYRRKS